jgi:hypothetical protein
MLFGEAVDYYCENYTEHRNEVRISQETHYVSATETNRLMLFRDAMISSFVFSFHQIVGYVVRKSFEMCVLL